MLQDLPFPRPQMKAVTTVRPLPHPTVALSGKRDRRLQQRRTFTESLCQDLQHVLYRPVTRTAPPRGRRARSRY